MRMISDFQKEVSARTHWRVVLDRTCDVNGEKSIKPVARRANQTLVVVRDCRF